MRRKRPGKLKGNTLNVTEKIHKSLQITSLVGISFSILISIVVRKIINSDNEKVLTFLEIGKFGRLGNQMFQVASTIGIALDNNFSWAFPQHIEDSDVGRIFNIRGGKDFHGKISKIVESNQIYHQVKLPKSPHSVISLHGYYQSFLFFDHHKSTLKKVFKPNQLMIQRILSKYPGIMMSGSVSIHVRRGDYISKVNQGIYTRIKINYFETALKMIAGVKRVFVVSDDIIWCRKNLKHLPYDISFTNGTDILEDFFVMALSHSLIISNSSFGWWAAYLKQLHYNNGSVIAPKPWYNEDGQLGYLNKNAPYFYLKHWILVDAR